MCYNHFHTFGEFVPSMLTSSFLQIMELNNTVQLSAFAVVVSLIYPGKMNGGNERFLKEKIQQGRL